MKELMTIARNSMNDKDGFLNGFIKGAFGGACVILVLTVWTGYIG